jgi:hypothetical protein
MKPKYYVRPDDYMVFSLNENGTYSMMESKKQFPDSLHSEYQESTLINYGFMLGLEADFPLYKKHQDAYYRKSSEDYRTDGHGDGDFDE